MTGVLEQTNGESGLIRPRQPGSQFVYNGSKSDGWSSCATALMNMVLQARSAVPLPL